MASRKVQAKISKMLRQHGRKTSDYRVGERTEKAISRNMRGGGTDKQFRSINRAAANDRVSNYLMASRFNRKGDRKVPTLRADRMSAAADIRRARAK